MGELAANTLLEKISGNNGVPKVLKIQPELVVRETTAPNPQLSQKNSAGGKALRRSR
jgi:hypothetical protein